MCSGVMNSQPVGGCYSAAYAHRGREQELLPSWKLFACFTDCLPSHWWVVHLLTGRGFFGLLFRWMMCDLSSCACRGSGIPLRSIWQSPYLRLMVCQRMMLEGYAG